jgi:hypothetical protein
MDMLNDREKYLNRPKPKEKPKPKPKPVVEEKLPTPVKTPVKAVKGDAVDEMFQDYIAKIGLDFPITRIGGGFYMFGTKKIYAKIMNGRLVIRVGGGFMGVEEFISTYADSEIQKLKRFTKEEIEMLHQPTKTGPDRNNQTVPL